MAESFGEASECVVVGGRGICGGRWDFAALVES